MKIDCIVVDDEPASRDVLRAYIQNYERLNLIQECKNANEADKVLREHDIELAFFDINMPKISGIDFVKTLVKPPKIIFTTAYPEYAVEGFEVDAVDYLLKPFSFERFLKAINKLSDQIEQDADRTSATVLLKADKRLYRVLVSDVWYIEAVGDYVKVVFGEQSILVHSTFQALLVQFPPSIMVQIHRSYAIAINRFQHIEGNQIIVNKCSLPIGKSFRKALLDRL